MNVFRSRKKSMGEADSGRPSLEKAPPVPNLRGRALFRRKQQPEPKPELNIALALPSQDDFRTSLLLPNLSARFSMLREQDDPSSLLGKASDDSVLFPKRASRMDLFGGGRLALDDIAEVSSIHDRRPFVYERHHSDAEASQRTSHRYSEEDNPGASIMDRAKPVQGNHLFGGRQKIMIISGGGGRSTKAVYNDDIQGDPFQEMKARERERELRREAEEAGDYFDDGDDRSSNEAERQPKRETNSSTNSNPNDRTSTAATSIGSQMGRPSPAGTPGERPTNKKRMYGQGMDQELHDQQSASTSRLNSLHRNLTRNGTTRSASNLNQQFRSASPFSPVLRSGSPSPVIPSSMFGGFDFGIGSRTSSTSRDAENLARQTPPMSPDSMGSPVDPMLVAALEPNDLGKATASGAFNKPRVPYNDQEFAQRRLQLQESGGATPPLRSMSRADSTEPSSARLRQGSFASIGSGQSSRQQFRAPSAASHAASDTSHQSPPPQQIASRPFTQRSGSDSASMPNSPEQQLQQQTSKVSEDSERPASKRSLDRPRPANIDTQAQPRTEVRSFMDPTAPTPVASAGFVETPIAPEVSSEHHAIDADIQQQQAQEQQNAKVAISALGPGLNDMIRGHLRQQSGASSVYPDSPTDAPEIYRSEPNYPTEAEEEVDDSEDRLVKDNLGNEQQESMSQRARQILERANQFASQSQKAAEVLGNDHHDKVQQILGGEAPRRSNESARHHRGASTETQKERDDFANELAERRKQVQENLMRMDHSQENSAENSPAKSGGFALLKKSSSQNIKSDGSYKAMRMLGMGGSQSPTLPPGARPPPPHGRSRTPSQPMRPSEERSRGPPPPPPGQGPPRGDRSIGQQRRDRFFQKGAPPSAAHGFDRPPMHGPGYGPRPPMRANTSPPEAMYYGRPRKYSAPGPPPMGNVPPPPPSGRMTPSGGRMRASPDRHGPPRHGGPHGGYFPPLDHISPSRQRQPTPPGPGPRTAPPGVGYSTNHTPPLEYPPPMASINPAVAANQMAGGGRNRNKSFSKHDISGPTFVSGTSSMNTVNLPSGASLTNGMNGMENTPPLPAMNPNRRKIGRIQTTQNVYTAFGGPAMNESRSQPGSAHPDNGGEFPRLGDPPPRSPFGDDPARYRRVRKISSEGGGMAAKARHQALMRDADMESYSMGGAMPKTTEPQQAF